MRSAREWVHGGEEKQLWSSGDWEDEKDPAKVREVGREPGRFRVPGAR